MSKIRLATDVGGTFTDLVFYEIDEKTGKVNSVKAVKSHTTPPNFEEGVMDAVSIADVDLKTVEFFAHGTTVVINALMERKGCLLYTSPSPRDQRGSRMPSSA